MCTLILSARRVLLWSLALLLLACTDPYYPEAISSPPNFLVVDGFINVRGISTIRLSHTFAIASAGNPPPETKATLYIEEEAGPRYALREGASGTYTSAALTLNTAKRYRLSFKTLAGKEYASDFVPAKITPPIDNVRWRTDNIGLNVYVNTHDATNTTQYYRWETDETWEIIPIYTPIVEYVNHAIRDIAVPFPSICWGNTHSTIVQIDKTTALSQDVVSDFRVRQIAPTSERLYSRYSILVQQHALTQPEYAYWELLRKNTESIGSLFDPQPAQLTGNVHSISNASEITLGYVGAHSLTEKRIFIRRSELPRDWRVPTGYEDCQPPDTVFIDRPAPPPPVPAVVLEGAFGSSSGSLPIEPVYTPRGGLAGYTAKSRGCIDCRTRGASIKPSYWP